MIDNEEQEGARRKGPVDPGVSKYTVMQLIEDGSDRVQFEESQTHSAVWERFLKILLDNCEVPFVCCKYCKKVMFMSSFENPLSLFSRCTLMTGLLAPLLF